MESDLFCEWGEITCQGELASLRLRQLILAVARYPYTSLVEIRRHNDMEGLVIDCEVELPQNPPVPIQPTERIVIAYNGDNAPPSVFALRRSFPETLHQNLTPLGGPKSLCLFEEPYIELQAQLTPARLLQRISEWLRRAGTEELHLAEQPLEPLLLTMDRIIFDREALKTLHKQETLTVVIPLAEKPLLLHALQIPVSHPQKDILEQASYLMLSLTARPWHSRSISHQPQNLQQLVQLLQNLDIKAEDAIRLFIKGLANWELFQKYKLILMLELPKTRTENGPVENSEWWAFLIHLTLGELGVKLGCMAKQDGRVVQFLGKAQSQDLDSVSVLPLRPTYALSRTLAQQMAGIGGIEDAHILTIGAGALGSQVVLNLARQGVGMWTIVDPDQLLPHNLVRHGLWPFWIGQNKADALAAEIRQLLNESNAARSLSASLCADSLSSSTIDEALASSDLILDLSTSRAVSAALANSEYCAPRLTAFMSSSGLHLIALFEGQGRSIRLDDLEVQLAVSIAEMPELSQIHQQQAGTRPYAGSCRDASVQLPQDIVALHAGVMSQFVRANLRSTEPSINIWEWSQTELSMSHRQLPIHLVTSIVSNGWTVRLSSYAQCQMRDHRQNQLPNETGGVLLGKIDYDLRTVYVGTMLSSPQDSCEWPTTYVRGAAGLYQRVETIKSVTGGELYYVGEWHSHPKGVSNAASRDDRKAHQWLVHEMGIDGLPGIIAIQGDEPTPNILIALVDEDEQTGGDE
ncbi:MAG: ThiF family adenylyltransferase [Anaerolineae bacterium]|nr:ThiF family adenylyltransferase [Anaerolineae bacterium]